MSRWKAPGRPARSCRRRRASQPVPDGPPGALPGANAMDVTPPPHASAAGAAVSNGPTPSPFPAAGKGKTAQEVKVHPEGETVMTFETNLDGNLDEDIVDAVIKGTIAFKYRIKDNVWRIISKNDGVYSCPPDGWGDREYIPIQGGEPILDQWVSYLGLTAMLPWILDVIEILDLQ